MIKSTVVLSALAAIVLSGCAMSNSAPVSGFVYQGAKGRAFASKMEQNRSLARTT